MSGYIEINEIKDPLLQGIANALESVGSGFHHTSDWTEKDDYFDGKSGIEVICDEFKKSDRELQSLRDRITALQKRQLPEGMHLAKFRDGRYTIIFEKDEFYWSVPDNTRGWELDGYYLFNDDYMVPGPHKDDIIEIDGEKTEAGEDQ